MRCNWQASEPEAAAELEDAVQWHESRRAGLGLEFARGVRVAPAAVERELLPFPEAKPGIRSCVGFRTPRISCWMPERVTIIEIFHHRRDPAQWQARRSSLTLRCCRAFAAQACASTRRHIGASG